MALKDQLNILKGDIQAYIAGESYSGGAVLPIETKLNAVRSQNYKLSLAYNRFITVEKHIDPKIRFTHLLNRINEVIDELE